jgi:hypothetical protein
VSLPLFFSTTHALAQDIYINYGITARRIIWEILFYSIGYLRCGRQTEPTDASRPPAALLYSFLRGKNQQQGKQSISWLTSREHSGLRSHPKLYQFGYDRDTRSGIKIKIPPPPARAGAHSTNLAALNPGIQRVNVDFSGLRDGPGIHSGCILHA